MLFSIFAINRTIVVMRGHKNIRRLHGVFFNKVKTEKKCPSLF